MRITKSVYGKCIGLMLSLFAVSNNVLAGSAYRDFEVEVHSPSSAQGLVYVDVNPKRPQKAYSYISGSPGQTAKVKANFGSTTDSHFRCELLAYPKPGYALAGFVGINDYNSGKKTNYIPHYELFLKTIYPLGQVEESDKLESDPIESSSYKFAAKKRAVYYAIFKPAVSVTVNVSKPGELEAAHMQTGISKYELNDIVVNGSINEQDIKYLKYLVEENSLIRIDLSKAHISSIPENAFSGCATLYEIKLPLSGLKTIGKRAFFQCHTLKKVVIPSSVTYIGDEAFGDCYTIEKGFNI